MKTQVNLFDKALLPVAEQWSLQQLAVALGCCAALLLLFWAGVSYQQQHVKSRLVVVQQQLNQQLQQQEQYQQLLQQRTPAADLVQAQARLQMRIQRAQRITEVLQQHQQQPQMRFSQVMGHLQAVDAPDIWLTEFRLQQSSSSFHGYSLRSAEVPGWLVRLSELPYFQGQSFQRLNLQQADETGLLMFHVEAQPGSTL